MFLYLIKTDGVPKQFLRLGGFRKVCLSEPRCVILFKNDRLTTDCTPCLRLKSPFNYAVFLAFPTTSPVSGLDAKARGPGLEAQQTAVVSFLKGTQPLGEYVEAESGKKNHGLPCGAPFTGVLADAFGLLAALAASGGLSALVIARRPHCLPDPDAAPTPTAGWAQLVSAIPLSSCFSVRQTVG